jgi:hypothetical protein
MSMIREPRSPSGRWSGAAAPAVRLVHSVCPLDCPDTCSWVVTVRDGRAVQLEGDREHPWTAALGRREA